MHGIGQLVIYEFFIHNLFRPDKILSSSILCSFFFSLNPAATGRRL